MPSRPELSSVARLSHFGLHRHRFINCMFRVPDLELEKQREDYFADDVKKEDRIC
eukprot:COSAG01_NODE_4999_length_4557_cov_15.544674_7_plen_54_part_01